MVASDMHARSDSRHLVFVLHGARANQPQLRHLVDWVRERGHQVTPRVTWEPGDATKFAVEASRDGADAVVAFGGDGTVNEVVNGLVGTQTPLGIVPMGTANDFARQAGIPMEDADHAMDIVLRGTPTAIDVGELNGRAFINVSTGGVGAEATAETAPGRKQKLGALAYAITGVKKLTGLRARRAWFHAPGFEHRGDYLLFAVGNGRSTGGGTLITPRADVQDGLLDVCIIDALPRAEFARLVLLVKRGEHLGHPAVRYLQVPELIIEGSRALAVNVDGEPVNARRLHYRALPSSLRVFLPQLPGAQAESPISAT